MYILVTTLDFHKMAEVSCVCVWKGHDVVVRLTDR